MTRYGFAINLHRCIGCRTCTVSCKMENTVADGIQRIRVLNAEETTVYDAPTGQYPALSFVWTPVPCQHCDNAVCVEVCPQDATYKRDDGIVVVKKEACIGCKACMEACPYNARSYDESTKTVDKCTLCAHRLDGSLETTMCQLCCPNRAIVVGDLDDPNSPVARIVAEKTTSRLLEDKGTNPNGYYWNSMA